MQFHQLRENILSMDAGRLSSFIVSYTNSRAEQLNIIIEKPTKKSPASSGGRGKKIAVTPEQLEALKKLGLI